MKLTPDNKKYLKIGAGVLAAIILYKIVASKTDSSGSAYDPTGNGTGGTAINPNFNAAITAMTLLNAMKEAGTEEENIFEALKNVSQVQFAQVIAAFKTQPYNTTTGNQYTMIWGGPLPKYNLQFWLKNELNSSDYAKLRQKYPQYL